ncbi:nitroreductase family protein [Methanonatronarchaeum sp. AMET-Sl]|uniref:nitroreductase family protein n=1 Tax=Methanonatronarchaeum sp. AMET-Sl TaxID=3037654 RepID=UPI00244E359D|nr:nitroreductase family protein [Methanonatronarchaeum sp. AMET-Sl]WGI17751.1 nitroreductase family protein [Methanonatronarchaeum sp. AMET-Sl]
MDLSEAIYRRKSVRSYKNQLVDEGFREKIKQYFMRSSGLFGADVEVVQVSGKELHEVLGGVLGSYGKIVAPHYLALVSNEGDFGAIGSGFFGEELVLFLTKNGLGSCWIGKFGDRDKIQKTIGTEGFIHALIAYGHPEEGDPYRLPEEASRKEISELVLDGSEYISEWREVLRAVRFAPSSINSQPWRFTLKKHQLDLYIKTKGLKKKIIKFFSDIEHLNLIDSGIALKHIEITSENPEIIDKDNKNDLNGYRYIVTVRDN